MCVDMLSYKHKYVTYIVYCVEFIQNFKQLIKDHLQIIDRR